MQNNYYFCQNAIIYHVSVAGILEKHLIFEQVLSFEKGGLTRSSPAQRPFYGTSENSAKRDQTPQDAASDLGLHCLLTE